MSIWFARAESFGIFFYLRLLELHFAKTQENVRFENEVCPFFDFASLKCELQIGIYAAHRAWSHRLWRVWKTGAIAEWRKATD